MRYSKKTSKDGIFYADNGAVVSCCDNHIILDKFKKNGSIHYKIKCNIHSLEKDYQKSNLLNTGCKLCNYEQRRVINEKKFYDDFNNIEDSKEFEILSKYVNAKTPVLMRHNVCMNEFSRVPDVILRKTTKLCLACNNSMHDANTLFTYKNKYEHYYKKEGFEIIAIKDKHLSTVTKFNIKHITCGNTIKVTHDTFHHSKVRCKYCNGHLSRLHGIVHAILDINNISVETEYRFDDCRNTYPLPFDFKVNISENEFILIEVDGEQHYDTNNTYFKESITINDKIKDLYCIENGITLIRLRTSKIKSITSAFSELSKTFNITSKPDYKDVEKFKQDKTTEEVVRLVRKSYTAGMSCRYMSKKYDISITQIWRILKYEVYADILLELKNSIDNITENNSHKPPRRPSILLPHKDEIFRMRKDGMTYTEIGKIYNVSKTAVRIFYLNNN